jgi:hypothetical protein
MTLEQTVEQFVSLGGTINGLSSTPLILNWLNGLNQAEQQMQINAILSYIKANGGTGN